MRKMSNRTKDKITVTLIIVAIMVALIMSVIAISRLFAENIVEIYDTDVYTYTTVEYDDYLEVRTFDKQAGKYLESSYIGKNFGEE